MEDTTAPVDIGPFHVRSSAQQQSRNTYERAADAIKEADRLNRKEQAIGDPDTEWFVAASVEKDPRQQGWRRAVLPLTVE